MNEVSSIPTVNFNVDNGYLEGLIRGLKGGILKQSDYLVLIQCETLEGTSYTSPPHCLRFETSFAGY